LTGLHRGKVQEPVDQAAQVVGAAGGVPARVGPGMVVAWVMCSARAARLTAAGGALVGSSFMSPSTMTRRVSRSRRRIAAMRRPGGCGGGDGVPFGGDLVGGEPEFVGDEVALEVVDEHLQRRPARDADLGL
jgi:hypothetical protein